MKKQTVSHSTNGLASAPRLMKKQLLTRRLTRAIQYTKELLTCWSIEEASGIPLDRDDKSRQYTDGMTRSMNFTENTALVLDQKS